MCKQKADLAPKGAPPAPDVRNSPYNAQGRRSFPDMPFIEPAQPVARPWIAFNLNTDPKNMPDEPPPRFRGTRACRIHLPPNVTRRACSMPTHSAMLKIARVTNAMASLFRRLSEEEDRGCSEDPCA